MRSISKRSKLVIVISVIALIALIVLLILNLESINAYGTIKQVGGAFILESEVIDCELNDREFVLLNSFLVSGFVDQKIQVSGLALFDYLTITAFNESYDVKSACFEVHEEDIVPEPLNYTTPVNVSSFIEYNISNFQDQRLFYECKITTDCDVVRDFYTDYINPGEVHLVHFNITCPEGVHEASIKTVFVDELVNYHTIQDELVITSS